MVTPGPGLNLGLQHALLEVLNRLRIILAGQQRLQSAILTDIADIEE